MEQKLQLTTRHLTIFFCLAVVVSSTRAFALAQDSSRFFLSADSLKKNGSIYLAGTLWKYHAGDDSLWASPAFDDSDWIGMRPTMDLDSIPKGAWTGIGWFRLHFAVDSALRNKTLAVAMNHDGASVIYLDGALVHRFGTVSASEKQEKTYSPHWRPIGLHLDGKAEHLLAVRYSFLNAEKIKSRYGVWAGFSGFLMWVRELNSGIDFYVDYLVDDLRINLIYGTVPPGILVLLSFLHFMLFAFYAREKSNLYFSLFAAAFACGPFFAYLPAYAHLDIELLMWTRFLNFGSSSLAATFGFIWLYSVFYSRIQKQIWVIVLAAIFFCVINIWRPQWGTIATLPFLGVLLLEALRVVGGAILKKYDGAWIIGVGGLVTILIPLVDSIFHMFPGSSHGKLIQFFIVFGQSLSIPIAMSVFLSRNFAQTNKNLEAQLVQVKELSEKTVQQEVERARLEAENARKTRELEQARQLQLSMLPKTIPQLPNLEIAVYMQTATEVGGDYYDFNVHDDGTLTVAIGDATGHGLHAGTMVAATKSLFNSLADEPEPVQVLQKATKALKAMGFHDMYMTLAIAKFEDHRLRIASAGMPFTMVYRAATHSVEEIVLKGMPLGSFTDFPYEQQELDLAAGDTVLFMSDGFPERFNTQEETLGEERAITIFAEAASKPFDQIIAHLLEEEKAWANGRAQDDDVTFVVVQVKP